MKALIAAIAAQAALAATAAQAAVTTTFEFMGQTNINGVVTNYGPGFPPGGVARASNDDFSSVAAITGNGEDNPLFTFANSAISVGEASAISSTRITVDITNDTAFAQTATWNFLIFAGGAGIIAPNLNGNCALDELDLCQTYLSPFGTHDASAALEFGVVLDGIEIYSGDIFVDENTQTANFNNIALNNFGALPGNNQYFRWDETTFSQDLGIFAPGETKTLEFFVTSTVISSGQDGCFSFDEFFFCTGAQAGFGDPDGQNGGIIPFAYSLQTSMEDTIEFDPVGEIPVPGAIWMFLAGLGAAGGARRLKKRAS